MKKLSHLAGAVFVATFLNASSVFAQDEDVDISRLQFAASEFGMVEGQAEFNIKERAISLAEERFQANQVMCLVEEGQHCYEQASQELTEVENMSLEAHIEAANEEIAREMGKILLSASERLKIHECTKDGLITNDEAVSLLLMVVRAREGLSVPEISEQHIKNTEAFIAQNGLASQSPEDLKILAFLDAFIEQKQKRRSINPHFDSKPVHDGHEGPPIN